MAAMASSCGLSGAMPFASMAGFVHEARVEVADLPGVGAGGGSCLRRFLE